MKKFNIGIAALKFLMALVGDRRQGERRGRIAALKFLMALVVVNLHFGVALPGQRLAVPVFMFCSFFYVGCRFDLGRRIVRILFPFWFWSVVGITVLHSVLQWPMTTSRVVAQFVLGGGYSFGLWFMAVLLICSVFIWGLGFLKNRWLPYCMVLAVVALVTLQYSGVNYAIFSSFPSEYRYPCGRICEMLPFAISGCGLGMVLRGGRSQDLQMRLFFWGGFGLFAVTTAGNYLIPFEAKGFAYEGCSLLFGTLGLSVAFYVLGEWCGRYAARHSIWRVVFSCSSCIYYTHCIIGWTLSRCLVKNTMMCGLCTIGVSFVISLILGRIKFLQKAIR